MEVYLGLMGNGWCYGTKLMNLDWLLGDLVYVNSDFKLMGKYLQNMMASFTIGRKLL